MIIFAAIVIVVLTAAFIAWPWLKRYFGGGETAADYDYSGKFESVGKYSENEELEELYSQRDATYSAIEELEFDVKSGILSNEDSDALKQSYKVKAVSILKEIDDKEKGTGLDEDIERQIQELRQEETIFCECMDSCHTYTSLS